MTQSTPVPRGNEDSSSGSIKGLRSELSLLVEVLKAIKAHINDKRN